MRIAALTALLLLGACNDDGETTDDTGGETDRVEDILSLTGDAAAGGTMFASNCALCHGDDGAGTNTAPDLASAQADLTDENIVTIILDGEGSMQGLGAVLEDQEIADILAHVRTL